MKWCVLALSFLLISTAHADLLGSIKNRLGVGPYTSPMDALGIFRTGTCEAQLDIFRNTPKRTYRWMSQADQASADYLDALSSVVTPECAQRLAYHMAYVITKHGKGDRRRNNRRGQAAARSLERLLNMAGNSADASAYLTEVRSCFEPPRDNNPIRSIIEDITPVVRRSDRCSPVTTDRVKVVSGIQGDISNAYGIRRNADGGYDVLLNYEFRSMSASNQAIAMAANEHIPTPTEMMNRTRECFAEASPFLKGPGGETLNFQALTPTEVSALPRDQRPPLWSIDIVNNAQRGHNRAYASRFPCSTIIHETLHVLGLCDEYQENDLNLRGRCRITSMPNTIMNQDIAGYEAGTHNQYQCTCDANCQSAQRDPELWRIYTGGSFTNRFNSYQTQFCRSLGHQRWVSLADLPTTQTLKAVATTPNSIEFENVGIAQWPGGPGLSNAWVHKWSCSCNGITDPRCPQAIAEMTAASNNLEALPLLGCPNGRPPLSSQVVTTIPSGPNDQVSGGILTRYRRASSPSLLTPAHFNRVVNGLCENSATSNYVSCAEWAYKDSSCTGRPASCENPNYFLGL